MIHSFADRGTEDVFNGAHSKVARRTCPDTAWKVARRKLGHINTAVKLDDLRSPPGNHLEKLSGDRAGQHSIRINDQFRICFSWKDDGAVNVEITDYH